MKFFGKLLPHISIVLSIAAAVLIVLNCYNPLMGFLSGTEAMVVIGLLCASSFISGWMLVLKNRRRRK